MNKNNSDILNTLREARAAVLTAVLKLRKARQAEAAGAVQEDAWLVAREGSFSTLRQFVGGLNFSGDWENGTRFTERDARFFAAKIRRQGCQVPTEVIRLSDLRARTEAQLRATLRPIREARLSTLAAA